MLKIKVRVAHAVAGMVVCLAFLLCLPQTAQAHPLSSGLADPAGRAHAVELTEALAAANGDVTNAAFLKLFLEDPALSKRAFVALIDTVVDLAETEPDKAKSTGEMAAALAVLIEQQYGDPKPMQILTALGEGKESSLTDLVAYLDSLRPAEPEVAPDHYGHDKSKASDLPAEGFAVVRPYLLKWMRIQYAVAVASPELIIQELDTYPQVEAAFQKSLIDFGLSAKDAEFEQAQEIKRAIALQRLAVLAEVGLLDEFQKGSEVLLKEETDGLRMTSILLTSLERRATSCASIAKRPIAAMTSAATANVSAKPLLTPRRQ